MGYEFLKPSSNEDIIFVKKCFDQEDFKMNISDEFTSYSDVLIIKNLANNIGIFIPSIYVVCSLKYSRPSIYLVKNFRIISSIVLCESIEYLFEIVEVDRIIIQIFSHNIIMINCMNNLKIPCRGKIDKIKKIKDDYLVGLYFFDIDRKKYRELESGFSE